TRGELGGCRQCPDAGWRRERDRCRLRACISVEVRSSLSTHVTLSAAILAGGQARRFGGRDKGALLVDGRSIRDRQIAELGTLTSDILIVGGPDGPRPERAPASRKVADRIPGCGPLGRLHTALLESKGDRTLVIAWHKP